MTGYNILNRPGRKKTLFSYIEFEGTVHSLNSILSKGTLSESEKTFTVNQNKGTLTAAVVNYMGSELPSTGGMGTTVLYVAGTIMILAAGVFLVMKKKAENN